MSSTDDANVTEPPPIDFQSTVQRLSAALAIARGGMSFIFVVCNSVPLRNRILTAIKGDSPDALLVELAAPDADAFDAALAGAGETSPPVLFITNLDLPLLDREHSPGALTALNASRELWRSRFACPVVFFVSAASIDLIRRGAPDLWSRKSHVFEFADEGGQMIASPVLPMSGTANDIAIWPHARRTARLVELQARLAALATDVSSSSRAQQARWLHECGDLQLALGHTAQAAEDYEAAAVHAMDAKDWSAYAISQTWAAHLRGQLGDYDGAAIKLRAAIDQLSAMPKPDETSTQFEIVLDQTEEGRTRIQCRFENEDDLVDSSFAGRTVSDDHHRHQSAFECDL